MCWNGGGRVVRGMRVTKLRKASTEWEERQGVLPSPETADPGVGVAEAWVSFRHSDFHMLEFERHPGKPQSLSAAWPPSTCPLFVCVLPVMGDPFPSKAAVEEINRLGELGCIAGNKNPGEEPVRILRSSNPWAGVVLWHFTLESPSLSTHEASISRSTFAPLRPPVTPLFPLLKFLLSTSLLWVTFPWWLYQFLPRKILSIFSLTVTLLL